MDQELDQLRPTYHLCRVGFALCAFGMGMLCLNTACHIAQIFLIFDNQPALLHVLGSDGWIWFVLTPIAVANLLGPYLLWGRWTDAAWKRAAGLAMLLGLVGMAIWFIRFGSLLGFSVDYRRHDWLLNGVIIEIRLIQCMVLAGLATRLASYLGREAVPEADQTVGSIAGLGAVLWAIVFLFQTNWAAGWPLQQLFIGPQMFLLWLGALVLMTVSALQTTALCALASRQCADRLRELDREELDFWMPHSREEDFNTVASPPESEWTTSDQGR